MTIPKSVTSIGSFAFESCTGKLTVNCNIPNASYSGRSPFSGSLFSQVSFGNDVTTIGDYAFDNCSSISNLSLPPSLESIGSYAFRTCFGLTSVTIPNSVTTIGLDAFKSCDNLQKVIVNDIAAWCGIKFEVMGIDFSSSNPLNYAHHLYIDEDTEITDLIIPSSVTSIESYAFEGGSNLTSVTIPNSVTSIGYYAFRFCGNLQKVIVNDIAAWCSITFYKYMDYYSSNPLSSAHHLYIDEDTEITDLVIPCSVTSIGDYAFEGGSNLTSVTIPNSVTSIGREVFSNCSNLTSIAVGKSVTDIGSDAFSRCFSLTSVTLHCNRIGSWFSGLTSIKEIEIGDEVSSIENNAFKGCSAIQTIEIGNGVTEIGERAFASIDKLTDVYCHAENVPNTDRTAFENSYVEYVTLHVPEASIEEYKSVGPWSSFKEIVSLPRDTYFLTYLVDDEVYKAYELKPGTDIIPEAEPTREGYTFSGWSEIPATMPAHDVTVTGSFTINKYKLTYVIDGQTYKTYELEYGATITPEAEPTREGYTFSGWSEIPATMPAHDVTVTGTFSINTYILTYLVDGEEYKTYELEFGAAITPEAEPTKEGYSFSGWSEIPATMPAHDVTVTGTFSINSYKLTYIVDGEEYKTYELEYGAIIAPEPEPTKEGYTFSGWNGVPATMPAHDVIVTGTFIVNKYLLLYILDGLEYKTVEVDYGTTITPEPDPVKEGYIFSGWIGLPETMPAHTVIVTGTFTKGIFTLTYLLNGDEYKSYQLEYGATITPEPAIEQEGHTFSGWSEIPATMPAHDVTVTGTLTVNKYILVYILDGMEYKSYELEYGTVITPEPAPEMDGYEFSGWSEIPETMPAHMVIVTGTMTPIDTSIYNVMAARGEVRIYTPGGKAISKLQKGLNIVVMQDGTIKKIVVK